uniref:Uncharacterized protein n=1 Tax=Setaria viridis TaxID=4556 RepID=A0A4U6V255_SETVI|nr:hypothetical protein SEVIR_4G149200v2 [Setaria viridis]
MEEDCRRREEEQRLRMEQMFQYMQGLSERMGQLAPPPPMLFPPPQPPTTTPNQSTASNNQSQDPHLLQWFLGPPQ